MVGKRRYAFVFIALAAFLAFSTSGLGAQADEAPPADTPPADTDPQVEEEVLHPNPRVDGADINFAIGVEVTSETQSVSETIRTDVFGLPDFADAWPYTCTWDHWQTGEPGLVSNRVTFPTPGERYHLRCIHDFDPAQNIDNFNYLYGQVIGTADAQIITTGELIQAARDEITLPVFSVGISPDPAVADQVTGLQSWLWPATADGIDDPLAEQTAFAQVGPLGVELRVNYVSTTFDMGDGSAPVVCTVQVTQAPPGSEHPCTHTYLEEGNYTITGTSEWEWEFVDNAQGAGFTEVTFDVINDGSQVFTLDVEVVDLEALISR